MGFKSAGLIIWRTSDSYCHGEHDKVSTAFIPYAISGKKNSTCRLAEKKRKILEWGLAG